MKNIAVFTALLLLPFSLSASGRREPSKAEPENAVSGQIVEITGRVRLIGSMPFPSLVITDLNDNDWYVDDAGKNMLGNRDQQTVRGRGILEIIEMPSPFEKRRLLKELVLLG